MWVLLVLMRKNSKTLFSTRKKIIPIIGAFILALLIVLTVIAIRFSSFFFQLLFNSDIALKKTDDHINILFLGIGGGIHEGPNLSDSIIFASINPKTNNITLVSIPRDLWIPDMKSKVNAAYAIGEERKKGGGLILTKTIVSKVLNQPVSYGIRIDFDGFVKAVDQVGGLDITVDNAFDDYEYPIEGKENDTCGRKLEELPILATSSSQLEAFPCRYKHIHFDKGSIHLDGAMALQFVRSRHATGEEGSDFARSKRQEKTITAFKNNILSAQTFLNVPKVLNLYTILQNSIDTDIKQDEVDDFIRLAQKTKNATIESIVLDYGDSKTNRPGLLVNPPTGPLYDNQWVLIPRKGNGEFSEVQSYVSCTINQGNCQIPKTKNITR